jgi:peptide/nickel transport system permease protein
MKEGDVMTYLLKDSLLSFLLSIVGIVMLGAVPFMFEGMAFQAGLYWNGIIQLVQNIIHPGELLYYTQGGEYSLFPELWDIYFYSITLLFSAFFIALVLALLFAIMINLLPERVTAKIRIFSFVFESIPDVLIAIGMQFFIIWFFKKTNILLFQIVSFYDQKTYFVPILCLTVLPTLLILRILLLNMEEELGKHYVDTAKSKGMNRFRILWRHVLPNTLLSVFHQSRNILWFMLSNLLMVEYLFNIHGVTTFIKDNGEPAIFTISMILLFFPMFLFFTIGRILTFKWVGEK